MSLPKFEYVVAKSLEEASKLKVELGDKCWIMAGGTDTIPVLKDRVINPEVVVDIKNIPGLDTLEFVPGEGLHIGALTKLRAVEMSPEIQKVMPAVAHAAGSVASPQIRCKGTMVGNICNASPSCDTAPIELVMNAVYKTQKADGTKGEYEAAKFFKGVKKTNLEPGELVTEIFIPELKSGEGSAYYKHAIRKAMDLAIVGVAVWVKMEEKTIVDCRIALGGVAITPMRAYEAEDMIRGKVVTDELLEEVAVKASQSCKPISDVRASAEYRTDMVRVYTKRAFEKAMDERKA